MGGLLVNSPWESKEGVLSKISATGISGDIPKEGLLCKTSAMGMPPRRDF